MTKETDKKQSLKVTDSAIKNIKKFAKADGKEDWGLKIIAKNNDGLEPEYEMDFLKEPAENDEVLNFEDVKIYLDAESIINLEEAEIDFLKTEHGSGFKINNPNFIQACSPSGCGSCNGCG